MTVHVTVIRIRDHLIIYGCGVVVIMNVYLFSIIFVPLYNLDC